MYVWGYGKQPLVEMFLFMVIENKNKITFLSHRGLNKHPPVFLFHFLYVLNKVLQRYHHLVKLVSQTSNRQVSQSIPNIHSLPTSQSASQPFSYSVDKKHSSTEYLEEYLDIVVPVKRQPQKTLKYKKKNEKKKMEKIWTMQMCFEREFYRHACI